MKKVWVAGHKGMVGSSILRRLCTENVELITRDRKSLNLLDYSAICTFLKNEKPDFVFIAAAKVGGILANNEYPANFIYENISICSNLINACHENDVQDLIFLGSSCIYPKNCLQPIKEEYLLGGSLEPTNQWYAIAKIAGIKLCEAYNIQYGRNYLSVQPSNLYGPNDNFNLKTSHVLPALIRKTYEAKLNNSNLIIWGSGKPKREFLHVDDLSDALYFLANKTIEENIINIGSPDEVSILELSNIISEVIDFDGEINFDSSKPDGTQRKKLEISKMKKLGWKSKIDLKSGIKSTFEWYLKNKNNLRC
tara:strand:- start:16233 stop:17159 length:927 start_codon:yes stop_codon:yes gene_type:complete